METTDNGGERKNATNKARGRRVANVRLHPANEVANRLEPLQRSGYYLWRVVYRTEGATCSTT